MIFILIRKKSSPGEGAFDPKKLYADKRWNDGEKGLFAEKNQIAMVASIIYF